MDIIFGIRKVSHGSGRVFEKLPDLFLTIFELQRSLIYQFVCILRGKSNKRVTITFEHHPGRVPEGWTFVHFWATEKCDISICMLFARQIQWCGKHYLCISSLVSGRSSMDQEGFLKDDHIFGNILKKINKQQIFNSAIICKRKSNHLKNGVSMNESGMPLKA